MNTVVYCDKDEVMALLGVGSKKAYEMIRQINMELSSKGLFVIRGRCPRKYLFKRLGIEASDLVKAE